MSQIFELIYNGSIAKGFEPEQVKQNVAQLYKTEVSKVERLFSGELVVIKTDLDRETALKYQAAMKKAGAEVAIRPKQSAATQAAPAAQPKPETVAAPPAPAPQQPPVASPESPAPVAADDSGITMAEPGVQIVEHEVIPEPDINISAISMAEVGVDVADPVEVDAAPLPDISAISMAEAGAQIVEYEPVPELEIDVSSISMAEVGTIMADPVEVEATPIPDISNMSMAEPGEQIVEYEPVPEPDIDISALKVEEES